MLANAPLSVLVFAVVLTYLAIIAGVPMVLMWLAARFIGRRTAIMMGLAGAAFAVYTSVDIYLACQAEPIFHPPAPGSGGEGSYTFPCDAPAGGFLRLYYTVAGPLAASLLLFASRRHYQLLRQLR